MAILTDEKARLIYQLFKRGAEQPRLERSHDPALAPELVPHPAPAQQPGAVQAAPPPQGGAAGQALPAGQQAAAGAPQAQQQQRAAGQPQISPAQGGAAGPALPAGQQQGGAARQPAPQTVRPVGGMPGAGTDKKRLPPSPPAGTIEELIRQHAAPGSTAAPIVRDAARSFQQLPKDKPTVAVYNNQPVHYEEILGSVQVLNVLTGSSYVTQRRLGDPGLYNRVNALKRDIYKYGPQAAIHAAYLLKTGEIFRFLTPEDMAIAMRIGRSPGNKSDEEIQAIVAEVRNDPIIAQATQVVNEINSGRLATAQSELAKFSEMLKQHVSVEGDVSALLATQRLPYGWSAAYQRHTAASGRGVPYELAVLGVPTPDALNLRLQSAIMTYASKLADDTIEHASTVFEQITAGLTEDQRAQIRPRIARHAPNISRQIHTDVRARIERNQDVSQENIRNWRRRAASQVLLATLWNMTTQGMWRHVPQVIRAYDALYGAPKVAPQQPRQQPSAKKPLVGIPPGMPPHHQEALRWWIESAPQQEPEPTFRRRSPPTPAKGW